MLSATDFRTWAPPAFYFGCQSCSEGVDLSRFPKHSKCDTYIHEHLPLVQCRKSGSRCGNIETCVTHLDDVSVLSGGSRLDIKMNCRITRLSG